MKKKITIIFILTIFIVACGQESKYPGQIEIRGYKIGEKVDTTSYKKINNLYFPNYLDGWTTNNVDKLPKKYKDLPIAIWQSKKDSGVVLTLLDDQILNIVISYIENDEKEAISKMISKKFDIDGKQKSYEESHFLQSYKTYWNLITWQNKDVIFQIGNSNMRMPNELPPDKILWELVYSDFIMENKIIDEYKKN